MRKLCKAAKRHHIDGLFILLPVSYNGVETKPIFFKYDERNATVERFLLYATDSETKRLSAGLL